jgi:hypothetical protein
LQNLYKKCQKEIAFLLFFTSVNCTIFLLFSSVDFKEKKPQRLNFQRDKALLHKNWTGYKFLPSFA